MVSNPMMRQHIGVPYPAGQARKRQISLYFPVDQGNWGNTETGSLETASSSAESCANQAVLTQAVIPHMCSLEGFCRGSGEDVRLAVQGRD